MRKTNPTRHFLLGFPILLSVQTKPFNYQELEQSAFTLSNIQSMEVFFDWLASPFVQNCCLVLMVISSIYCAVTILLYALTIREAIPTKQWIKDAFGIESPKPVLKESAAGSLQKKWSEQPIEEFLLDTNKERLINSLLP